MQSVAIYPIFLNALASILSFWHRSMQMHDDSLVKNALLFIANNDTSESEWMVTVKVLVNDLGMYNYFLNPGSITTIKFTQLCNEKIKNKFSQQWVSAISNEGQSSKLRFYKQFKDNFCREPYLDHLNVYQLRKIIHTLL